MFPQDQKEGGGIEDLEAVYALAHTLLAYTTILCCVNTVKRGVLHPFPPLGGNTKGTLGGCAVYTTPFQSMAKCILNLDLLYM